MAKRKFYECTVDIKPLQNNVFKKLNGHFVHVDEEVYVPVNPETSRYFRNVELKGEQYES